MLCVFLRQEEYKHFTTLHSQLGLSVLIVVFLQPLNALIRPHPGEKWRAQWSALHRGAGYGAVIVVGPTIYYVRATASAGCPCVCVRSCWQVRCFLPVWEICGSIFVASVSCVWTH